jgi:hypothetical protein
MRVSDVWDFLTLQCREPGQDKDRFTPEAGTESEGNYPLCRRGGEAVRKARPTFKRFHKSELEREK